MSKKSVTHAHRSQQIEMAAEEQKKNKSERRKKIAKKRQCDTTNGQKRSQNFVFAKVLPYIDLRQQHASYKKLCVLATLGIISCFSNSIIGCFENSLRPSISVCLLKICTFLFSRFQTALSLILKCSRNPKYTAEFEWKRNEKKTERNTKKTMHKIFCARDLDTRFKQKLCRLRSKTAEVATDTSNGNGSITTTTNNNKKKQHCQLLFGLWIED